MKACLCVLVLGLCVFAFLGRDDGVDPHMRSWYEFSRVNTMSAEERNRGSWWNGFLIGGAVMGVAGCAVAFAARERR